MDLTKIAKSLGGKFLFSLIGIFFSIFWSYFVKKGLDNLEANEPQETPHALLQKMVESQRLQNEFLSKINSEQTRHTTILENIRNQEDVLLSINEKTKPELLESILEQGKSQVDNLRQIHNNLENGGEYMRSEFTRLLATLKDNLDNNIGELAKKVIENQQEVLRIAQLGFSEKIDASMTKTSEDTLEAMKPAVEAIKDMAERMASLSTQLNTQVNNAQTNADTSIKAIEESMKSSLEATESKLENINKEIVGQIDGVMTSNLAGLENAMKSIESLHSHAITSLETTSTKFVEAVDSFNNSQDRNNSLATAMEEQLELVRSLKEEVTNSLESWKTQNEQIDELRSRINDISNTIIQLDELNRIISLQRNN